MSSLPPPVVSPNLSGINVTALELEQIAQLQDLPDQFKKGWRTTEFWQSAIIGLVPVVAFGGAVFGVEIDQAALIASLSAIVPATGYVISRSWLKRKRLDALTP